MYIVKYRGCRLEVAAGPAGSKCLQVRNACCRSSRRLQKLQIQAPKHIQPHLEEHQQDIYMYICQHNYKCMYMCIQTSSDTRTSTYTSTSTSTSACTHANTPRSTFTCTYGTFTFDGLVFLLKCPKGKKKRVVVVVHYQTDTFRPVGRCTTN